MIVPGKNLPPLGLRGGEILQVLLFSILFGFALMGLGERGHTLRAFIDDAAHGVFGVIAIVMEGRTGRRFRAMAFTIGKFGTGAILNLIGLIATFYLTAALFVFVVLGIIARIVGFSIFKFLAYIKDELLIVLGTSSSESALPSLMENSNGSAVPSRSSAWWCRPDIRSISMARTSI